MTAILDGPWGRVAVSWWWEQAPEGRRLRFLDGAAARRFAALLLARDRTGRLGRLAAAARTAQSTSRRGEELRDRLAAWLERGSLRAYELAAQRLVPGEVPTGADERAETVVRREIEHWIEIELVDTDGIPLAGERYRIELASGIVLEGRLGPTGKARHRRVDPGPCKVTFPYRDPASWYPAENEQGPAPRPVDLPAIEPAPPDTAMLHFELIDEDGEPLAGEPFVLTSPDGTRYAGVLDARGSFEGGPVEPGTWRVEFPERSGEGWWTATSPEAGPAPPEPTLDAVQPYWPAPLETHDA